jgi:hypothetical protein
MVTVWKEAIANPSTSKADKISMQQFVDNASANDVWAIRAQKDIGILLTSHPGNRAFLKASVESHKKLGYWLALTYDNYIDPKRSDNSLDRLLPNIDVMNNIDTFIMPHHQTWGGVLYPYFWCLKFGLDAMSGFKYVYCSNGDCILEKPENFPQIIELLGDNDIVGCGWEKSGIGELFNTTAFIATTEAAKAIMLHFQKYLVPFDMYDKYTEQMGNTESRFAMAIRDLGLKSRRDIEMGFNTQFHVPGYGTWYKILGFRHIHAELGYAYKYHKIPPEPKYLDRRHMSSTEYECVSKYHETKNEEWLKKWWK